VRILCVEDMPELQKFLHLVLTRAGHVVETASDGEEAWARLARPDCPVIELLITDHQMPRLNGLELVRRVRRAAFAGKIGVFASQLSPDIQDGYEEMNADFILAKPSSPTLLRAKIEQLFPASDPDAPAQTTGTGR
jgi:CheY-like chemotaxis protein